MKKRLLSTVLLILAGLLCCIGLFACKGGADGGKETLTFRHYVEEDVAEIGGKYLINRNQAFDADGNGYVPEISVERGGEDITSLVNNYVLDTDVPQDFTVTYTFTIDGKAVVYTTSVKVVDTVEPQIMLEGDLPDELEFEGELTLPAIQVTDNSGKEITPAVNVYKNSVDEENILTSVEGKYSMSSDVKNAYVVIIAGDESGNEAVFEKKIRVRRKGEKSVDKVDGLIKYLSATDSTILNDAGVEYVYSDDTVNSAETEIVTVEMPGALVTTFPTLVFKLPEEKRANCVITLDVYMENMSGWISVFPQFNGSGAAPEFGRQAQNTKDPDTGETTEWEFAEGKWVSIRSVFNPTEINGYNPDGVMDSIRLTFPGKGTNGVPAIIDSSEDMVIKVANLKIHEVPKQPDLSVLGDLGNIGNIGNIASLYPFTEYSVGKIGDADALELTMPAGMELPSPTSIGTLTFDLQLSKEYETGAYIQFDWEVENMDLYTAVSGYNGGAPVTTAASVTRNSTLFGTVSNEGAKYATFTSILFYFELGRGDNPNIVNGILQSDIVIRIANLKIMPLAELEDLGEAVYFDAFAGILYSDSTAELRIAEMSNGKKALEIEINPADPTFSIWFKFSQTYAVGSVISFQWEVENLPRRTYIRGCNGNYGASTTAQTDSGDGESVSIVTAQTDSGSEFFDRIELFCNKTYTGGGITHTPGTPIVIRITDMRITPPENEDSQGISDINEIRKDIKVEPQAVSYDICAFNKDREEC